VLIDHTHRRWFIGSLIALAPMSSSSGEASASAAAELEPSLRALLDDGSASARESAAQRLLQAGAAGVPGYARELARLELGRSCSEKRSALRAVLALHDTRATPALRRLSSEPSTGCGPRKDQDCLGCLRRELRAGLGSNG